MKLNYITLQEMFNNAFSEHMERRAEKNLKRHMYIQVLDALERQFESTNESFHADKVTGIVSVSHDEKTNESVYIVYGRGVTRIRYETIHMVLTGSTGYVIFMDNIATDYENVSAWPLYNLMAICEYLTDLRTPEAILWSIHMAEVFDRTYMPAMTQEKPEDNLLSAVYQDIGATLTDSITTYYEDAKFCAKVKAAYAALEALPIA